MSQINMTTNVGAANTVDPAPDVQNTNAAAGASPQVPPTGNQNSGGLAAAFKDLPILPDPRHGGLSLEQLVQALGVEGRQTAVKAGLESIEVKKAEIKELNDKKMEDVQKQLEELKKREKLNPILKFFKWIGMILGAIASVASVIAGALTGNPLLIVGGAIGLFMMANSITSEATGGKISLGAGIAELAKKCGASEETAKWIGFGFEIGVTAVGMALSIGGAVQVAKAAKALGEIATTVQKVAVWTAGIANATGGAVQVGQGGVGIAAAVHDKRIADAKADLKELEALMLRITQAQDIEKDLLEAVMERTQALIDGVMDIIDGNIQAQTAVLTSAPGMA
ncbi:MAG: type III secretion system translocon subunit SctE [Desulfovibrionaceae bacterium]|nr:type III secretion system translocon subunit SctE [Desulfovibrionaceae bacterium]